MITLHPHEEAALCMSAFGTARARALACTFGPGTRQRQRGEVERGDGDGDVRGDAEEALEVVGLLVAEVVPDGDDGEDEDGDLEDLEAQVELEAAAPGDDDDERGVEHGGLDGRPDAVGEREVDLVVPRLVEGREVLGGLLDERHEDETHERVGDAALLHQRFDLADERERDERHEGHGHGERDGAFG